MINTMDIPQVASDNIHEFLGVSEQEFHEVTDFLVEEYTNWKNEAEVVTALTDYVEKQAKNKWSHDTKNKVLSFLSCRIGFIRGLKYLDT